MKVNAKKLDGRHNGHKRWKYYISFNGPQERAEDFFECRLWCWENFGPSREMDETIDLRRSPADHNIQWAWANTDYKRWLYFSSDAELALFQLRWS